MIPLSEYAERRKQLLSQIEDDAIVIVSSASEVHRSGDGHFPFRQNNNFYYLTGFNEPDAILVLVPNHPDGEFILFNRPRDVLQEIWNGRRAGQEGACNVYGADQAYETDEFFEQLPSLLQNRRRVYYPVGRDMNVDEILMDSINQLRSKVRAGIIVPEEFHNIEPFIFEMRLRKSQAEIDVMRKAAQISVTAHKRAMQACKPGMYEYELEAELLHEFVRQGCKGPAYSSIVGGGANACILHYIENTDVLNDGDLVLIDAGGEYQLYSSDITRTFPINGKFSEPQKQIYELVLRSQLAAIDMLRPGLKWMDIQQRILHILTEGLVELGILQGSVSDLLEQQAVRRFYMHNSGHWLGLDTHDAGVYKTGNDWRELEAGFVLTVEPGLYIAAADDIDSKWWNIGIRIEDDVLITKQGYDVLTSGLPKTVAEIESLMAHKS